MKEVLIITGFTNTVNVHTGNSRYENTYLPMHRLRAREEGRGRGCYESECILIGLTGVLLAICRDEMVLDKGTERKVYIIVFFRIRL